MSKRTPTDRLYSTIALYQDRNSFRFHDDEADDANYESLLDERIHIEVCEHAVRIVDAICHWSIDSELLSDELLERIGAPANPWPGLTNGALAKLIKGRTREAKERGIVVGARKAEDPAPYALRYAAHLHRYWIENSDLVAPRGDDVDPCNPITQPISVADIKAIFDVAQRLVTDPDHQWDSRKAWVEQAISKHSSSVPPLELEECALMLWGLCLIANGRPEMEPAR